MSAAIEIPGWDDRFETAQSRRVQSVTWTPFRHSLANLLRRHPPEVGCCIVQVILLAATMPRRGVLNDGGCDLTLEDVSLSVGFSVEVVTAAMSALGACYERAPSLLPREREREGRREGGKERGTDRVPSEPSSAHADADLGPWFVKAWNTGTNGLPKIQHVGKERLRMLKGLLKRAGGSRDLVERAIIAFGAWDFANDRQLGADTFLRAKSRDKHLEWALTGPPGKDRAAANPQSLEAFRRFTSRGED